MRKQNDVETWQVLHGRVFSDVAVNLAAGGSTQCLVLARDEPLFLDTSDLPESHITDNVSFYSLLYTIVVDELIDGE